MADFTQQLAAISLNTDTLRYEVTELLAEAAHVLPPAILDPSYAGTDIVSTSSQYDAFFKRNETRFSTLIEHLTRVQLDLDALEIPRCLDGVTADPAFREARRNAIRGAESLIGDVQHLKTVVLRQARIAFPAQSSPPRDVSFLNNNTTNFGFTSTTTDTTPSPIAVSSSSSASGFSSSASSYSYVPDSREIVAVSEVQDVPISSGSDERARRTGGVGGNVDLTQLQVVEADIMRLTDRKSVV